MDRKEFIEKVAEKTGADYRDVENVFQKFIDLIITALRDGEKVSITGFGTFSPKITKATKKFSPILKREIEIPEKFIVSFSPSSKLADEINIKYKDEKPKIVQEASEREIERKVTILPEDKEEFLQAQKPMEDISKLEEEKKEEASEVGSEDVSLSVELLEALQETETKTEATPQETRFTSVVKETKEEKEGGSQMPEMNLNQDKPKFTFGEDFTTPSSTGGYKQSFPSSTTTDAPAFKEKESSNALWVTLVILLIGIIGVGIYWALSSDVTETKKETFVSEKKETTPPVVVEKQPTTKGKKEIIIAPEEYANVPTDTSLKQNVPLIVEEPRKETKVETKKPIIITEEGKKSTEITKVEEKRVTQTLTEKRKPITRRVSKATTTFKRPLATTEGDYFIQVNSYTQKRFADEFARNLRNKGYRAFVESAVSSVYGTVYRVKVGFYNDEDAASKDYHSLRLLLKKEDIYVDRR